MPVRFRCRECRSTLSIARRKAGTTVACPTCKAAVLVPESDDGNEVKTEVMTGHAAMAPASANGFPRPAPPPAAVAKRPAAKPQPAPANLDDLPLFERDDFAKMLEPASREAKPEPPKPADPPRPAAPNGILILRSTATVLVAAVVVLLGLAFAAGFLVGSR